MGIFYPFHIWKLNKMKTLKTNLSISSRKFVVVTLNFQVDDELSPLSGNNLVCFIL